MPSSTIVCAIAGEIPEIIASQPISTAALAILILGFAGGAMLDIISDEIIPEAHRKGEGSVATGSLMMGVSLMLAFGALLESA